LIKRNFKSRSYFKAQSDNKSYIQYVFLKSDSNKYFTNIIVFNSVRATVRTTSKKSHVYYKSNVKF